MFRCLFKTSKGQHPMHEQERWNECTCIEHKSEHYFVCLRSQLDVGKAFVSVSVQADLRVTTVVVKLVVESIMHDTIWGTAKEEDKVVKERERGRVGRFFFLKQLTRPVCKVGHLEQQRVFALSCPATRVRVGGATVGGRALTLTWTTTITVWRSWAENAK